MSDDPDDASNSSARVTLELYDLSVEVDGAPDDDLDDVEATATELMDYLVEQHYALEQGPDDRDRF